MVRQGRSVRAQILIFLGSFAYLAWGTWDVPLATGFTDPVAKVRPQDEALYSSISIGMAALGEWFTPRYLGRLAFVKPIGAFLPQAIAVRLLGASRFSLRLFSIFCGAAVLTLFYVWGGWTAFLLLAANPLFFLLARRNMTDVPVFCAVAFTIFLWSRPVSAATLAWGVLTKSVAGFVPALFLWERWWKILAIAIVLIAPWHLYHLAANSDWYWKEHVLDEHLQWGIRTPVNAAPESHASFYFTRAWVWDPILTCLAPVALAVCLRRKAYREAAWLAVSTAVLFGFGYRNATYLLPIFGAAAIGSSRWLHWTGGAAAAALQVFLGGISYTPPPPVPPAAALWELCDRGREAELMVYSVGDELTASALPFRRVQYLLPADPRTMAKTNIDFAGRGIIAPASEFRDLPPPAETVLLVPSNSAILHLLHSAPGRVFLLPSEMIERLQLGAQRLFPDRNGWGVVGSRPYPPASDPHPGCRL